MRLDKQCDMEIESVALHLAAKFETALSCTVFRCYGIDIEDDMGMFTLVGLCLVCGTV